MRLKYVSGIILLLINSLTTGHAQDTTTMKTINQPYIFGVPETYDFQRTENGTKGVVYERNGWVIEIWKQKMKSKNGTCYEYAPALDFYEVIKYYYPNGMLKERGKYMLGVPFGQWEYFDENGKLMKVEDKDAKFKGVKVTREDVLAILEKEGWINRQTGANSIDDNSSPYSELLTNPLKTDGSFYRLLQNYIRFNFNPAVMEGGKEVTPPIWFVTIDTYKGMTAYTTTFKINGHTGKYTIRQSSYFMED